jgi:hypothetical protein
MPRNRPADFGFMKREEHGDWAVYEKQTPDMDANPRLTLDKYPDSDEWLVRLEAPADGGMEEFSSRTVSGRPSAEGAATTFAMEYDRAGGL